MEERWQQRFSNFKKALNTLEKAVLLAQRRSLSDLENQGLIQGFEFTHELCWKTMKDFIESRGNEQIYGSKDATREAFNLGLIHKGEIWMVMIKSRKLSSHTYDEEISVSIADKIITQYFSLFKSFEKQMLSL